MPENAYLVAITALLPLTVLMLVTQQNPYHALVIRGIVGAIAALVYALFGAADVALTEALVGTMLSITLYAIAVRSSMTLRLGILESSPLATPERATHPLWPVFRQALRPHYLRLEIVAFSSEAALQQAWISPSIHAVCTLSPAENGTYTEPTLPHVQCRLPHLYHILKAGIPETAATLSCANQFPSSDTTAGSPPFTPSAVTLPDPLEGES